MDAIASVIYQSKWKGKLECSICLENQEAVNSNLVCGHVYHRDCIMDWALQHNSCPHCRQQVAQIDFWISSRLFLRRTQNTVFCGRISFFFMVTRLLTRQPWKLDMQTSRVEFDIHWASLPVPTSFLPCCHKVPLFPCCQHIYVKFIQVDNSSIIKNSTKISPPLPSSWNSKNDRQSTNAHEFKGAPFLFPDPAASLWNSQQPGTFST